MGVWLDRLGVLLLDAGVAALAWIGLMALAMVACGQPARRCALARATLLGALAVWPLVAWRPGPRIDLPALLRLVAAPGQGVAPVAAAQLAGTGRYLIAAYAIGVAVGLCWLALGWLGSAHLKRGTVRPGAGVLAAYERLAFPAGRTRPRLASSPRVRRPVLAGAFRLTIVLPRRLEDDGTAQQVQLSLLHELAHAERHDPAYGLVAGLAQAFWFFLPPLWWVRRQMRLDQEFLTDHLAASAFGGCVTSYASSLVEMAGPQRAASPEVRPGGAVVVPTDPGMRRGSALLLRVLMLVRCPFPVEPAPPWWWRLALAPLAVLGVVTASSLSLSGHAASLRPSSAPAASRHGRLDVPRLVLDAEPAGPPGASRRGCVLPIALPDRFELSLEYRLGPTTGSPVIELAGYTIRPTINNTPADGWTRLRLSRGPGGVSCWLDDQPTPCQPGAEGARPFLQLRLAPGTEGQFRNLSLVW
jgi:hypothetical protein